MQETLEMGGLCLERKIEKNENRPAAFVTEMLIAKSAAMKNAVIVIKYSAHT